MTLDQIQVLQTILDTGSFRAASQKLHRAQSAVSYAIRLLEDEIGFALFDRTAYRPKLTAEGAGFIKKATELLTEYQGLQRTVEYLKRGHEPQIRLAISAHYPLPALAAALRKLSAQFPQTEIKIYSEVLSGEDMLIREQVDLAISEIFQQRSGLQARKIFEVIQVPVCALSHPLAKLKNKSTPEQRAIYSQVILRSTLQGEGKSAAILNPLNTISVDNFLSKKELIRSGLGWGFMPEHLVAAEIKKKELVITHKEATKIPLSVAIRQGQKLGPCADLLWNYFCSTQRSN